LRELNDLLKGADALGLEKTRSRQQKRDEARKPSKASKTSKGKNRRQENAKEGSTSSLR
jgi:hypothetical protein